MLLGRRRRQHADPLRHVRGHRADRALALRDGARVDRRRAGREARATCSRCAASASPTSQGSIVSSTVPQLGAEWRQVGERYLGHETLVVGPGIKSGMPIRYENPREIGADRLVNAVAAYDKIGDACVVVDFGTAITFDPVSAEGEYLGGVIAPGVEISMEALTERAAALPKIDLVAAALGDRQDDRRRDPLRRRLRLRRPGRRDRRAACAPSWAPRPRRSPPAASRARSCRTRTRSTRSTTCSP